MKPWAEKFYKSKAWYQCRKAYIMSVNGLCERCLAEGKFEHGYIVHHKVYLTAKNINDPNVSLNWDNLEYVCQDCHNKEHTSKYTAVLHGISFDDNGDILPP